MRLLSSSAFKAFRNAMLIGATGLFVRLLHLSLRTEVRGYEAVPDPASGGSGAIYVFWHENILCVLAHPSRRRTHAIISAGRDGDFATRVLRRWFRVGAVRGSTSRQALSALRAMLRDGGGGKHFAFTPDGPRGPRRSFDGGPAFVASRIGRPVVPIGAFVSRCWRLRTWDRMVIPKPFARLVLEFGPPLALSPTLDRDGLVGARAEVEAALVAAQERAETKRSST